MICDTAWDDLILTLSIIDCMLFCLDSLLRLVA